MFLFRLTAMFSLVVVVALISACVPAYLYFTRGEDTISLTKESRSVWELKEDALLMGLDGSKPPAINLVLMSKMSPNDRAVLDSPNKKMGWIELLGKVGKGEKIELVKVVWESNSLYEGFTSTAEILSGPHSGTLVELFDLFKFTPIDEAQKKDVVFRYKGKGYSIDSSVDGLERVE